MDLESLVRARAFFRGKELGAPQFYCRAIVLMINRNFARTGRVAKAVLAAVRESNVTHTAAAERGRKNRFQTIRYDRPLSTRPPAFSALVDSCRAAGYRTNVARDRAIFPDVTAFPTTTEIFTCEPFSSVES